MAVSFVLHRVADYDAWRRVYDSVADMQRQGGVTAQAVFQAVGDPNNVLVMHRFASAEQAHAFFEIPELQQTLKDAGVDVGSLRVEFYEDA